MNDLMAGTKICWRITYLAFLVSIVSGWPVL